MCILIIQERYGLIQTCKTIKEILKELKNKKQEEYPKNYIADDEWEEWLKNRRKKGENDVPKLR